MHSRFNTERHKPGAKSDDIAVEGVTWLFTIVTLFPGLRGKGRVRSAECGVWKMRSVENAECGKCGVLKKNI